MSRKKYEKCLDILNLKTGASLKDIKSAYKKLVLKFHPDRQTDPIAKDLANEKLKKINEAREFILDNYKYYGKSTTSKSSSSKSNDYSSEFSSTTQTKKKKRTNTKTKVQETKTEFKAEPINEEEIRPKNLKKEGFNGFGLVALVFFIIFVISVNFFEDKTLSDSSNNKTEVVKLNSFDDSQPKTKAETVPKKEVEYVEEVQEEPKRVEVKPVQQKPLTESERIAKFEKEMSKAFDNYINNYGQYYDYSQLKDRTFTVEISSYLNNTLYRCKYINGDFTHEYEGSNLYRDFESFILGLPIYFRDDAKTNNEMRYKMRVTHTPQGTTVKLLDIWHYLEGDYR